MKVNFVTWAKAAGIRALRTFAQSFASLITVGALISDINWGVAASSAAVAAVYSLLMSIASLPEIKAEENYNVEPPEALQEETK